MAEITSFECNSLFDWKSPKKMMLDSVNLFWLLHMLQLVSLFDLSIFLELMTCIDFIYDVNWRHEFPACTNGGGGQVPHF